MRVAFCSLLVWLAALPAGAQAPLDPAPASPAAFSRGWVDVNIGVAQPRESSFDTSLTTTKFLEPARFDTTYHASRGAEFDFGGGVMLTRTFGLGISFIGTAHQDAADLAIRIPQPYWPNDYASDARPTDGQLKRTEGSANIQAVFQSDLDAHNRIRFFAGPTWFQLRGDAITDIRYTQQYNLLGYNAVEITSYDTKEVEATGWGVSAGADYAFFFNRHVGVGGMVRYSAGTVTIDDANVVADASKDVKVGGLQAGGGLRLRF